MSTWLTGRTEMVQVVWKVETANRWAEKTHRGQYWTEQFVSTACLHVLEYMDQSVTSFLTSPHHQSRALLYHFFFFIVYGNGWVSHGHLSLSHTHNHTQKKFYVHSSQDNEANFNCHRIKIPSSLQGHHWKTNSHSDSQGHTCRQFIFPNFPHIHLLWTVAGSRISWSNRTRNLVVVNAKQLGGFFCCKYGDVKMWFSETTEPTCSK